DYYCVIRHNNVWVF
nr:immunoglobulin light chain junction region [Macaca mulatta]